jgi:hypothetical protein
MIGQGYRSAVPSDGTVVPTDTCSLNLKLSESASLAIEENF